MTQESRQGTFPEIAVEESILDAESKIYEAGERVKGALLDLYSQSKPPTEQLDVRDKNHTYSFIANVFVVKREPIVLDYKRIYFLDNNGVFRVESSTEVAGVRQEIGALEYIQLGREIATRIIEASTPDQSHITPDN